MKKSAFYESANYIWSTGPQIADRQKRWAYARGVNLYVGCTQTLEENLFQPLTKASYAEFRFEAGSEIEEKMRATYSSSALVCNVFDYWRNRPSEPLAAALGAPVGVNHFHFEVANLTGLRDGPPQFDVVFGSNASKPFLIEATFTGPYGFPETPSARGTFTKSYFPDSGEIWGRYRLIRCEALARRIYAEQEEFHHLGARQLLTRILGLAKAYGKDFTLLYLWYDHPSYHAAKHRAEIETFILRLNGEIDFRAMTYQELFQKIQGDPSVDEKYIAYLKERYFA